MGAWCDTQAAYYGRIDDSKRLEKQCPFPQKMCDCCMHALTEEVGYNNHKAYCLLLDRYV